MKLLRLKLDVPFRSLAPGFEIHFLREWDYNTCLNFQPYCLVGRNGSGKSNVLEALAAIFYHLECIYLETLPDGFRFGPDTPDGFQPEKSTPDAFELEYFFKNDNLRSIRLALKPAIPSVAHIRITKVSGDRPKVFWLNRSDYEDNDEIELRGRSQVKEFLPKFILGYSSGHNEILSLPFFKMRFIHFDEYRNRLVGDLDYGGKPEGGMIYVDDQFSQAILLCHYLFPSEAVTVAATIVIKVKLRTKDVLHLQPDEIDLTFSSPTHEEEVESWKDVFGIEERYKAKLCSESDGKAWLQRITEESTDSNLSKDQALEYELRAAKRVIEHDAGFLKIPFLIACRDAKIV